MNLRKIKNAPEKLIISFENAKKNFEKKFEAERDWRAYQEKADKILTRFWRAVEKDVDIFSALKNAETLQVQSKNFEIAIPVQCAAWDVFAATKELAAWSNETTALKITEEKKTVYKQIKTTTKKEKPFKNTITKKKHVPRKNWEWVEESFEVLSCQKCVANALKTLDCDVKNIRSYVKFLVRKSV